MSYCATNHRFYPTYKIFSKIGPNQTYEYSPPVFNVGIKSPKSKLRCQQLNKKQRSKVDHRDPVSTEISGDEVDYGNPARETDIKT